MGYKGCPNCGKTMSDAGGPCPHCGSTGFQSGPTIACEKCKQGTMVAKRVPRMGSGLNLVGYTLLIPSILLLVFSTACGALVVGSPGGGLAGEHLRDARRQASNELLDIREVPRVAAEGFAQSGELPQETLQSLPSSTRERVEGILGRYRQTAATDARVATMTTGIAGFGLVAVYVICLPFLIVGLLLVRKKNVWQCSTCAYVFERA